MVIAATVEESRDIMFSYVSFYLFSCMNEANMTFFVSLASCLISCRSWSLNISFWGNAEILATLAK
jgi:hypothetical protein